MKDIRVDAEGEFRCWNCGNKGLLEKRTFRSKMMLGVGSLLTKKKLKCQTCGEYNDTGNARPYDGPASRKWRKRWEKAESAKSSGQREVETRQAQLHADALTKAMLEAAAEMRSDAPSELPAGPGPDTPAPVLASNAPADAGPAAAVPPPPPPPPAWAPDPTGRHELRYWDGQRWTEHISDEGRQGVDPIG